MTVFISISHQTFRHTDTNLYESPSSSLITCLSWLYQFFFHIPKLVFFFTPSPPQIQTNYLAIIYFKMLMMINLTIEGSCVRFYVLFLMMENDGLGQKKTEKNDGIKFKFAIKWNMILIFLVLSFEFLIIEPTFLYITGPIIYLTFHHFSLNFWIIFFLSIHRL